MHRRPEEPAERSLDLHGFTVPRALARLAQELHACRFRGIERLLVITGRGWGTREGSSTLTPAVRTWLEGADAERQGVRHVRATAKGGALLVDLEPPRGRLRAEHDDGTELH